jgi:hypothetical protein
MMKRFLLLFILSAFCSASAIAQDEALFGSNKTPAREGFIITMNAGLDFPAADMAKRFGTSYRFGPSVGYKTKDNWIFGAKFDFLVGSNVREDSLLINLFKDGGILNGNGVRTNVNIYERGYAVGLQAGRIFPLSKKNTTGGIMTMTTLGFIQHKIKIFDRDKAIPQIKGDYQKGYDRLTNGILLEEFIGYNYFSADGYLNFYIGLNISTGFTQGRRDFLYDVMRTDDGNRLDILYGLRAGLHIPIFNRKSEELYFK